MSSAQKIVLAFDAYGTLLSTESIAKELAKHFGDEKAQVISATWRKYQLEYTWRLNSMNQYIPFSSVTRSSLHHALAESKVTLEEGEIDSLMNSYDSLSVFPDVHPCLEALRSPENSSSISAVVFSNGTNSMVSNSVNKSPDLSSYASVFSDIVVVDEVKVFKPNPATYYHLAEKVGKGKGQGEGGMKDLWLVSGNPFDVVGARGVGMNAVWVDRAGTGWQDRLIEGDIGRPTLIVKGLHEVVEMVKGFHG